MEMGYTLCWVNMIEIIKGIKKEPLPVPPWNEKAEPPPIDAYVLIDNLGGGFKYSLFSSLLGEDSQFDYCNIFQMG